MLRFLHAADIHLDSPLRGLERYPDAPADEVRAAPRRAFENLVQLAIDERVAFVLLAGDLYDGDWRDYRTGQFFVGQMRRLAEADIRVHLVSGNHDAASQITKSLRLPGNVVHHAIDRPQTVEYPGWNLAIHGQSFRQRSVTRDLAADYPSGRPDRIDIGLLHTSLDGRPGHAPYAPTRLETLCGKGYDYWALGHVHAREVVCRDPWVVFPGNLQGRHARETGAKGCTLVEIEDGEIVSVEARAVDVVRWAAVEVDASGLASAAQAVGRAVEALARERDAADGRLLAARLTLVGATPAHGELVRRRARWLAELQAEAAGLGEPSVWLERVSLRTRREQDLAAALDREDAIGDLARRIAELEQSPPEGERLAALFGDLRQKLPADLREGRDAEAGADDEGFDPCDPDAVRALLPEVRDLLLERLIEAGGGAEAAERPSGEGT